MIRANRRAFRHSAKAVGGYPGRSSRCHRECHRQLSPAPHSVQLSAILLRDSAPAPVAPFPIVLRVWWIGHDWLWLVLKTGDGVSHPGIKISFVRLFALLGHRS